MSDYDIHSCGYYCDRFACVLRQRNELRDNLFVASEKNTQISDTQSLWRKRQSNNDVNRSQGRIRIINEPQFFEWWNGDELVEGTGYEKGTPIYWAMQGWQAANKEPWVKTYSGGKPNYTQPKEWISLTDDEIADAFGDYMDSLDESEEEEHNWDYERLIEAKIKEKNGYLKEEK
ncbi:MAG: hypothetical protein EBU08_01000 [Micrococcales bacterium]|nr:hypothetical protein [Micrococcales bacterium]